MQTEKTIRRRALQKLYYDANRQKINAQKRQVYHDNRDTEIAKQKVRYKRFALKQQLLKEAVEEKPRDKSLPKPARRPSGLKLKKQRWEKSNKELQERVRLFKEKLNMKQASQAD
jgi:hypothetical protein